MSDVLTQTADSILQKPVTVEVDIINPTRLQRLLIFLRLMAPKRKFELRPLVTGSLIRISVILIAIDHNILRQGSILENSYTLIKDHGRALAEMLAIAFTNTEAPPPDHLVNFLIYNLTPVELRTISDQMLAQMNIDSFISTIISTKGMSLLKAEEIIASGEPSVA